MIKRINPDIRKEIQLKLDKIADDSKYYDDRKKLVIQDLRSIGNVYSFWIENPKLRKSLLLENRQPKTLRKEARKGIQAVNNGWYFLYSLDKTRRFIDSLSPRVLERLNRLVEPQKLGTGEFRRKDVTLNLDNYTPPSWEKVPQQIRELISNVKETYHQDPIEAAILAHLGIGATQPFVEGNKRCARLVQDKILYDAGLPPAVIPAGEGTFYFDLFGKTLPAYKNEDIDRQRQFYDFCASKINNGLDDILGDLSEEVAVSNH